MKKLYRIKKNQEFSQIIGKKQSFSDACFVVYFQKKKQDNSRVGISVSKKLGNAVKRNLIKRQVREMIKALIAFDDYAFDMIIIVRKGFLNNNFSDNKTNLEKLIKKSYNITV